MAKKPSITRRDFLDGALIGTAAIGISTTAFAKGLGDGIAAIGADYYPPMWNGMRGNHPGSFDAAHALAWSDEKPPHFEDTGEAYDLIVVGGGFSGLAAATLFQQKMGKDARILILDNHDDFGGHAKRNEFSVGGKMLLGIGGSVNFEMPENYSKTSRRLLEDVGINFDDLKRSNQAKHVLLGSLIDQGMMVHGEDGTPHMIVGKWFAALHGKGGYEPLLEQLPVSDDDKQKLMTFVGGEWDYLAGLSLSERIDYLTSTAYHDFLSKKVGLSQQSLSLFDSLMRFGYGVGGDVLSISEAVLSGAPGLGAVGWPFALTEKQLFNEDELFSAMIFPDGNASAVRLFVRHLIPGVAPGTSMDDIASARFDYGKLDMPGTPVRMRLNSTAVRVEQTDDEVEVSYVQQGKALKARAKHTVLACYNSIIPHLCPALPDAQKEALKYGVKVPFVFANVALRNGKSFYGSGAEAFECPGSYFQFVTKSPEVVLPDFQTPAAPTDPLVVFMMRAPTGPRQNGESARDLYRQARYELLDTPFSEIEDNIKTQLTEMFGPYGFDADRDIEAITVNRWSHGYAYDYMDLHDPKFEDGAAPHEIGRKQFGRISIANSDAEARAYLDAAIDAAGRAVEEQVALSQQQ